MSIRTAHEAFLQSPYRVEFERMASTTAFDYACEMALLSFLETLPRDQDPNSGWGRDSQRVGAIEVIDTLRKLHLKPEEPAKLETRQLKPPK